MLIYDFRPSEADAVFERWLDGAADDPTQGYTRADLAEHIRSEHSTFRRLLEPMLATAGFEILTADFGKRCMGPIPAAGAEPSRRPASRRGLGDRASRSASAPTSGTPGTSWRGAPSGSEAFELM
jgi:hypothetical protein